MATRKRSRSKQKRRSKNSSKPRRTQRKRSKSKQRKRSPSKRKKASKSRKASRSKKVTPNKREIIDALLREIRGPAQNDTIIRRAGRDPKTISESLRRQLIFGIPQ